MNLYVNRHRPYHTSQCSSMAALHFSPRGISSEMKTSIFPPEVFSIAFYRSRTNIPYSAR
jgi:hypothetical protein